MDPDLMPTYKLHSFGCKVNTYDSGLLQKKFLAAGMLEGEPRVHVLNTCAVTAEATREAVRLIRRLKVRDPFCRIVVTGCAAQVDTGSFSELPNVDLVVANSHKGQLPDLISKLFKGTLSEKVFKSNIFRKDDLEAGGGIESHHTRSFLKIQDGCNSFCTYCVIPFARGKSRSIGINDLVLRVNELHSLGASEMVLTGVHIGDYADPETGGGIEKLVEALLRRTKIQRFRLSSLEPVEISEALLELYRDPRMCAHFHMSIQSASTPVLLDMKRKYAQSHVVESLVRLREKLPGCYIGMDVIAGFPTETEDHFAETLECLKIVPWTRLHVFPYSERPGTRAATLAGISVPVRKARAQLLRELSQRRWQEQAELQCGTVKKVLVLKSPSRGAHSLSRDYWPVALNSADNFLSGWAGQEIDVRITAVQNAGTEPILCGEVTA